MQSMSQSCSPREPIFVPASQPKGDCSGQLPADVVSSFRDVLAERWNRCAVQYSWGRWPGRSRRLSMAGSQRMDVCAGETLRWLVQRRYRTKMGI